MDEVLSGFRTGLSCAQGFYGVTPDLCLLAKALTNGVPLAAIAGRERIMAKIMDPHDPVIAGGTFSGNLMGCAAGVAAMAIMEQEGFFDEWRQRVDAFYGLLQAIFDEEDFPAVVQGIGCTFGIYVGTRDPVRSYHDIAERTDGALRKAFFRRCIEKGLYFHTDFTVSAQHDSELLARSLEQMREAVRETKAQAGTQEWHP
jgi:glutamate-1-semialdehyde 2,1-aminomutase